MEHLTLNHSSIEIKWYGNEPKNRTCLVLLHEGLGCVSMWKDFPEKLAGATNFKVMAYSRMGYGGSDPCSLPRPVGFMHHEGLDVLPEILDRTGIKRCFLMGHSDGGSIALIHAGGAPHPSVRGVITMAAHVFCESLTVKSIEAARQQYLTGTLKQRLLTYHGKNTDSAFWGWNDVWLHPDFRKWNIKTYLPRIKVPVLAVQGEKDPYGTPDQIKAIKNLSGGKTMVEMIPNCGHAPHIEQQTQTLGVVVDFIRSLPDGY